MGSTLGPRFTCSTPALSCHEDTAQGTQSPSFASCCVYMVKETLSVPGVMRSSSRTWTEPVCWCILPGVGEGWVIVNISFPPTPGSFPSPGPRVLGVVWGGQTGGGGGGGGGGLTTFPGLSRPEHDSHHLI